MLQAYQANQIIASVEREVQFHEKYLEVLSLERQAVTAIALDNCRIFGAKREALCEQIALERNKRQALLNSFGGENVPPRLSDFVRAHFAAPEQRRVFPLIEKLKNLVRRTQSENEDLSQVLNFSLGLVNSSLSFIRSASQEVQHGYNMQGIARESVHPVGHRQSGVLRQA